MTFAVRTLVALAAIPALMGFAREPDYSISFPSGWDAGVEEGLTVAKHPSGSSCNSYTTLLPASTANASQSDLNQLLVGTWGAAEWADLLGVTPDKIVVVETRVRMVGAYNLRTGTVRIRAGATSAQSPEMMAYLGISVSGGRAFNAGCYAQMDRYTALRGAMEETVNSLRVK